MADAEEGKKDVEKEDLKEREDAVTIVAESSVEKVVMSAAENSKEKVAGKAIDLTIKEQAEGEEGANF